MLDSGQQRMPEINKLETIKLGTGVNNVNICVEHLYEENIPKFGNTWNNWIGKRGSRDDI